MRSAIPATLAALLLAVSLVPVASAAAPDEVTITSLMLAQEEGPNLGTFTVVSGGEQICAEGTVTDLGYVFSRSDHSGRNLQLVVAKEFGCADGTFLVYMKVHVDFLTGGEVFQWTIIDGTGAYTGLRGQGDGTTVFPADGEFFNTYTGRLHD
jgi:hypothetical protein